MCFVFFFVYVWAQEIRIYCNIYEQSTNADKSLLMKSFQTSGLWWENVKNSGSINTFFEIETEFHRQMSKRATAYSIQNKIDTKACYQLTTVVSVQYKNNNIG